MNMKILDDQQEFTYNTFVQRQDAVWREWRMMGTNGKRE